MTKAPVGLNCTLARLSFWVPAAHLAEFEKAYAQRLVPILKKHGLVESAERGRPTAEGIFSRLFEVEEPAAIVEKRQALLAAPDWQRAVQELDAALGILGEGFQRELQAAGLYLSPYKTPAGYGKIVPAGPGRQVTAGRGRGHWRTFDATDGLPGGFIRAVLQDREGYLWIGSWGGGLSRYDGHRFQHFTPQEGLASRWVHSVIEDRKGNLWIGTRDKGLFRYNSGQGFENFTTQDGLVADEVLRVFQDREGHIWVGTSQGLSRYDGYRFENFTAQEGLPGDQVQAIFQDQEGYLWFGTGELGGEGHRGGVSRYDGHRFQTFTTQEGLAFDAVWSILQDREGIFWFGTDGGLSRYDGRRFQTFTTEDGLGANNVWSILQDQEGDLWFGTKGGGVSRYDGEEFITFTTQDGLGDNSLEAIFQDREGSLWFGTWGGLSRYDSQLSTTFTAEDGLADDEVLALFQDREGVFWFGTPEGLSRYDGRTFTTFTAQDGLAANRVHRIFQDREGNLWFGHTDETSGKGMTRYDGQSFTVFSAQDGLGSEAVWSILQDQAGNLWFGDMGGVSRYDGARFEYFAAADDLRAYWVGSIFQDQEGVLWFGSGMGLSRYDGHTFTSQDSLTDKWVCSICQAQGGGLWLGTLGGGVLRYDGQGFKRFGTRDGLADDSVFSVFCDPQGRIWFGTPGGGVSLYDGQVFQTFTTQEGLGANNVSSILQDRERNLWFSTTQGVTRYRLAQPSSPPMYIDAVVADRRYEGETEITILASVKLLAVEFHGISFKTRPEAMIYRYRLEGYEEDWRNTHSRRVEYQDLPMGEYTFEVQAVDRDLNYSEVAEIRLKVVPDPRDARIDELEQRVRERTRELEETNHQLQEASRHKSQFLSRMSHDLRTPMNAILGYTRILLRKLHGAIDARQYQNLENIQLSADHLLTLINDILDLSRIEAGRIDLKPEQIDLKQLVTTSAASVESLLKPGVVLHQQLAEIAPLYTDPDRLRRVLMNLLSNAVKFTSQGSITVLFKEVEGWVEILVVDTGIGIPAEDLPYIFEEFRQSGRRSEGEKQGSGLGLAIAKRSVELLGGSIAVESEVGKGTTFTLRLKGCEGP